MSDIATVWDTDEVRGDWVVAGADLQSDGGLSTAVLISIFTDRRAGPDDVIPDGTGDPRGWWADDDQYPIGSRLWLLSRAKQVNNTLKLAKDYIVEALQWLINDGAAVRIDVTVQWAGVGLLGGIVTIYRQDGTSIAVDFNYAWSK